MLKLKDFKAGDTVYVLKDHIGRIVDTTITEKKVKKVGRKYVTLEGNWETKYAEFDACYLLEEVQCGGRSLLFKTKKDAENYIEAQELAHRIGCMSVSQLQKYSLLQLKRVMQILNSNVLDIRKVLITNGMSNDHVLFLTDAPKEAIEEWCRECNHAIENSVSYTIDALKTSWYAKLILDSEVDEFDMDDIQTIGYDEMYDLFTYYPEK